MLKNYGDTTVKTKMYMKGIKYKYSYPLFLFISASCSLWSFNLLLQEMGHVSNSIYYDKFNMFMFAFTSMIFFLMVISSWASAGKHTNTMSLSFFVVLMVMFFQTENFFFMFLVFEVSVIPLMLMISSVSYTIGRSTAMMYMYMYTVVFSMPALFVLAMLYANNKYNMNFSHLALMSSMGQTYALFLASLFMFSMKLPIWGFHFWLPKAHVEAPTEGSMLLAAIVLKLGIVGLMKASMYVMNYREITSGALMLFFATAFVGSLVISMASLRQVDSKIVVALSSIVHMAPCVLISTLCFNVTLEVNMLIMVAHGIVSCALFFYVGKMYEMSKSRSIVLSSGLLKSSYFMVVSWLLLCGLNMGLPISMNFLGEMNFFYYCFYTSKTIFFLYMMVIFLAGAYNIYLFNFSKNFSPKSLINIFCLKNFSITMMVILVLSVLTFVMAEPEM